MTTLLQDVRYGLRMLLRKPGFTVIAVSTLALGIGGNSAIFSLVNAVLLHPLPYADPNRLVMVFETEPELEKAPVTGPDYLDWKEQSSVFETMAAGTEGSANLTGIGDPQRVTAVPVSAGLFEMLGTTPALGRLFRSDEDQPGHNKVAILTHGLWQERFGSDPEIIGKQITLDGESFDVVGVMPAASVFPRIWGIKPDLWMPLGLKRDESTRGKHWLWVMARLKRGITLKQAQTEMEGIAARLAKQYPHSNSDIGVRVISLREQLVGDVRPALLTLFGAVGFVLLIACANVANLLLTRTVGRQREMAIRAALGASRIRLIRQLLTESVLLSLLGGVAGTLLALWAKDLLICLSPADYLPRASEINLSLGVLVFTLAVSLLTGILLGIVPAMHSARLNLGQSLKEGVRTMAGGVRSRHLRSLLVAAEVALGLVLLVGTGLMLRSLQKLLEVNPGFDPKNVLTMRLELPNSRYPRYPKSERAAAFFNGLIERVQTLPGVQVVAATSQLALSGGPNGVVQIEGRSRTAGFGGPLVQRSSVLSDYFRAMGISLLKGRPFTKADTAESAKVVIINQTLAHRFWPGEEPIGKRLSWGSGDVPVWREVVGVVADVHQWGLIREPMPEVYFPYAQLPQAAMSLVIRSSCDASTLIKAVREQVRGLDKELPVFRPLSMEHILAQSTAEQRFQALLMSVFGTMALVLAGVGLYGVMSYSVAQRTHEIGIRVALGAQRWDVLGLVLGQGMLLTTIGVLIGLAGAFATTRLMSSLLYGVSATDPLTFTLVPVLLSGVALLACYIPARRATKVDPMVALRYE
jgi:putative ABC transport system permease protein